MVKSKKKATREKSVDSVASAAESSDESVAMVTDDALSSGDETKSALEKRGESAAGVARVDSETAGCSAWRTVTRRGITRRTEEGRESGVPAESSDRAARKRLAEPSSSDCGETTDEEAVAPKRRRRRRRSLRLL
jgi:hypothetical protein